MTTIAVFNQKGGVGKTTLTVNLSAALYKFHKKKILIVDCDEQCNSSDYCFGMAKADGSIPEDNLTIEDYLNGKCSVKDIVYNMHIRDGRQVISSGIDAISSGHTIGDVTIDSFDEYKKILDQLKDDYDLAFLDLPPQKVQTVYCGIDAADYMLIPITTENDTSFSGYTMAVDLIDEFRESRMNETLKILGLVITRTKNSRSSLESYLYDQCREQFGDSLFDTTIRDAQAVNDALMFRTPVVYNKKSADVSSDYERLADEFLKRLDRAEGKVTF
ncbi:MAG: ParA family protein [Candidatus Weimeria sp.]